MDQPSLFSKIIHGEIPAHRIYEDEKTFVFLDIYPMRPGHMLIVPKAQVDRLEDLPDEDYVAVMDTVRKAMRRAVEVFGPDYRACLKVIGFDVPHAHVHVIPCRNGEEFHDFTPPHGEPDHEALKTVADKLRFE